MCSTVSGGTQTTNFFYDGNGNAYWRYENGHLYLQSWDGDNRLTGVQEKSTSDWSANNGAATTFYYDADGNRVKHVGPSGTTFYIGDHSELIPGVKWTQYYTFNGQRIAVRDGGAGPVSWLQGDHLGSASMATDANGAKTSEYRYTPYDGIDFAQARYYDSVIGRWLSADVNYDGGLEDPQGLNRYSYVKGHAMNAIDPTGKQCLISFLCPPPTVVMDTNVTPAVNAQDSVKATLEPQPTATGTPASPSQAATQQAKATPTQTATATRALETVTVYRMVRPDKISPSSFGYDDKSDVEPHCGISVYEELPPGAICFPMQVIYKGPKEPGRVGVIADPKL